MKKYNTPGTETRFAALDDLMPLMREQLEAGRNVRFSPRGVSMLPMLRQGIDSVVLSPLPEHLEKYDLPLYQRENGAYVLHRIVEAGDTYTCMGDNQFVRERGLEHRQMIALVTAFSRGGREIPVTDPGYRLYCRLWHWSRPARHFWRRGMNFLRRCLP
ncbi:MAG: S24/S26 family peptidase [Oscillospiraceae bacterium]|nr:S24/S26 family peptidase [Oscillospiraceae bacterium]